MDVIKQLTDFTNSLWKDTNAAARVGIILLVALIIIAVGGVGYWSSMPSYVTLVSDVDPDKLGSVMDSMEKAGIEFQLGGGGGVLKVDKRDFARARQIAKEQGVSVNEDDSNSSVGGMWLDPTDRKNIEIKKKERSLAASIKKLNVIDSADVHLNVPVKGPFERTTSKPSASVLLSLRPGGKLSDSQASSIASMVAYAVQDLEPAAVQITDKDGVTYSVGDELTTSISSQIEFVAHSENRLARKAEAQLYQFLGFENASVQVSLDLTFPNSSTTTVSYDSKGKVPSEEDSTTETTNQTIDRARGVAGVTSNLSSEKKSDSEVTDKKETIKTTYLVPKTEQVEASTTPIRNMMTVSVVVNSEAEGIKDEAGNVPEEMKAKIEELVKKAVGFKEGTDFVNVDFFKFAEEVESEAVAVPIDWIRINQIIQNVSLGIAAIAAILFGILTLRKIQPGDSTTSAPVIQHTPVRRRAISDLERMAQTNPEVFTKIINGFVKSDGKSKSGSKTQDKRVA